MKKVILFLLATGIVLYACKKDTEKETPAPPQIDTSNPNDIAAAIKVFYGARVNGTMPAANGTGAPALGTAASNTIITGKDGYAVIRPAVTSGDVSGYYLSVTGANSYFKVDYSKPRNARQAVMDQLLRITGKNADSLLVIQLPDNAKAGTFCVQYAAYDSQDRVSNVVNVCIAVTAKLDSTQEQLLQGEWVLNRTKFGDEPWKDDYYKPDTFTNRYICQNDTLAECYSNCAYEFPSIYKPEKQAYVLGADSAFTYEVEEKWTEVVLNKTPCTNNPPIATQTINRDEHGKWYYDPITQELTIVWPSNGPSTVVVVEVTDHKLLLSGDDFLQEYIR